MSSEDCSAAITDIFVTKTARATGFTVNIADAVAIFVEITPPLSAHEPSQGIDQSELKVLADLLRSVSDQIAMMPSSRVSAI